MEIINDPRMNTAIAAAEAAWRTAFESQVAAELAAAEARERTIAARAALEAELAKVGLRLVDVRQPAARRRATKIELEGLDEDVREAIRGGCLATPKALAAKLTGVSRSALRASLARIAGSLGHWV